MVTSPETLPPDAPISALIPVFQRDHVALIADAEGFVGVVTRIDFLNFLRKQLDS